MPSAARLSSGFFGGHVAGDLFEREFQDSFELVERDLGMAGELGFDGGADLLTQSRTTGAKRSGRSVQFKVRGPGVSEAAAGIVGFLHAGGFGLLALLRFEANSRSATLCAELVELIDTLVEGALVGRLVPEV